MGLDTVEIVLCWEQAFSIELSNSEAFTIETPAMAAKLIAAKVPFSSSSQGACLSMRAFFQFREALEKVCGIPRKKIVPAMSLPGCLPRWSRSKVWIRLREEAGFLPQSAWFDGAFSPIPPTLASAAREAVALCPSALKRGEILWTHREILAVVRAVVWHVSGKNDFSDDAHFIHDIGLD